MDQIKLMEEKIRDRFKPAKMFLFVSYTYGTPQKGNDVNFLLIMNTKLRYPKQVSQIGLYLDETVGINFLIDTKARKIIRTYFKIAEGKK